MKSKFKLVFALVASASILASCGPKTGGSGVGGSESGNHGTPLASVEVPADSKFTSLGTGDAALTPDADGFYTVAGQKIKAKKSYNTTFTTEPDDYDYLHNAWQYNSLHYIQSLDGLINNDPHGRTYGDLAVSYSTVENSDGTESWFFKLRDGVKWYDNKTHEEVADVVADDFVAGMEHVLDPLVASDLSYLPCMFIVGAQDYLSSLSDDDPNNDLSFDTVGVIAHGKNVIEYRLNSPTPFWLTNLTYGCYYPVNREYLTKKGTSFGASKDDILVNGAFFQDEHTKGSRSHFVKNPNYWDAEHVYFDEITLTYIDGKAGIEQARKLYEAGTIDGFNVQSSDTDGYKKYVAGADGKGDANNPADPNCSPVPSTDQFSFIAYFNFLRTSYEYPANVHQDTDDEKAIKSKALLNKNFRKGFLYGLNVMKYLPFYNQFDPVQRLNRAYTVKGLAVDSDGKDYVSYVEDEFNKEQGTSGVKLVGTELSEDASAKGDGSKGDDPIYNSTKAREYFDKARAELKEAGVIDDSTVIYIDVIGEQETTSAAYQKEMYDSIEQSSGGWVKCNILTATSDEQKTRWGKKINNYDFSMFMGWGADYGDPQSFLHTIIGEQYDKSGALTDMGDSLSYLGFNGTSPAAATDELKAAIARTGYSSEKAISDYLFTDYTKLYEDALKFNTTATYKQRLAAFAKAEYNAIYESAIILPWYTRSGVYDTVSKVVPHMAPQANYGLNVDRYRNFIVSDTPITRTMRDAINAQFNAD